MHLFHFSDPNVHVCLLTQIQNCLDNSVWNPDIWKRAPAIPLFALGSRSATAQLIAQAARVASISVC